MMKIEIPYEYFDRCPSLLPSNQDTKHFMEWWGYDWHPEEIQQ
jgi:hypothetical protein